jgi:dihydropteroate synthase
VITARAVCADRRAELELALGRMGLPSTAREYLLEKLPHAQVLLTGLTPVEGRFLKAKADREDLPFYVPGNHDRRPGTALVSGRRDQLERLRAEAAAEPELAELARALGTLLDAPERPERWMLGGKALELGLRTRVMGVVNVTPDSFSDGGRFLDAARAVEQGERLARDGADILDIGGESTRPGAKKVSADEELARILPVIRGLKERTDAPISVDTTKAAVAREALAQGAVLVNDISGFSFDPELPRVTAEAGAACCLMHVQGTPETMQQSPTYDDLVAEVRAFLAGAVARAEHAGIPRERIAVDPGIGFGKTAGHNLVLLRRLADLRVHGLPILVGTSRKSFLGALTGGKPAAERLAATLGSVAAVAVLGGADVVRVHDVAEVKDALAVADAIREATEAGDLFRR